MATMNITHGLPSPAVSARSPGSTDGGATLTGLPVPRSNPLKPGSSKTVALINYLDDRILQITRRYAKKFSNTDSDGDKVPGYTNFEQVLHDIEPVFDVVWISGTPAVQIPYALNLAGLFSSFMRAFTFTPKMFRLARKFDLAFEFLLNQSNQSEHNSHQLSITEKVRIKSLVDDTRLNAVRTLNDSGIQSSLKDLTVSDSDSDEDEDSNDENLNDHFNNDNLDQKTINRRLSKMYELTIGTLGDRLGSTTMPTATDDAACIAADSDSDIEMQADPSLDDEIIEL